MKILPSQNVSTHPPAIIVDNSLSQRSVLIIWLDHDACVNLSQSEGESRTVKIHDF